MPVAKIKSTNVASTNSMSMRSIVYAVEMESRGGGEYILYGAEDKINRVVLALPGVTVTKRFDALEFRKVSK